jgi:hypothetical protein
MPRDAMHHTNARPTLHRVCGKLSHVQQTANAFGAHAADESHRDVRACCADRDAVRAAIRWQESATDCMMVRAAGYGTTAGDGQQNVYAATPEIETMYAGVWVELVSVLMACASFPKRQLVRWQRSGTGTYLPGPTEPLGVSALATRRANHQHLLSIPHLRSDMLAHPCNKGNR